MSYVPPEVKERIKREISVERLAEARGIQLRRSGKELIGLCPFHKDTNPSLNIDPIKNVWHCKGACSEGGDVIRWVMRAEGVSFNHAVEMLKRDYFPSTASGMEPPPRKIHHRENAATGRADGQRQATAASRSGALSPNAEAVARGAAVSRVVQTL